MWGHVGSEVAHLAGKEGPEGTNFPAIRECRAASAFSVADLLIPRLAFYRPRLACGSDYAVVLDTTARTAFPATRPSNGASQRSNAVVAVAMRRRTREKGRDREIWKLVHFFFFFFIPLEFAVRMSEADDDAHRDEVATVRTVGCINDDAFDALVFDGEIFL